MLRFEDLPEVNSERWLSLEDLDGEVWKPVVGFEQFYRVSNYGRVKALERRVYYGKNRCDTFFEHIVKSKASGFGGYYSVSLKNSGEKQKVRYVHRLVATAFIPNYDNKPQIDHIDTNKHNNTVPNLRFCTAKENKHNPKTYKKHIEMTAARKKGVVVLNSFGGYVTEFDSVTEAAAFIGDEPKFLSEALKKGKMRHNYMFVYKSEYDENKDYCTEHMREFSRFSTISNTSVVVYRNGKIADVFANHIDAAAYYGINKSQISRRCSFYANPETAIKKFNSRLNDTDTIYNLRDISEEDKSLAVSMLRRKYIYS